MFQAQTTLCPVVELVNEQPATNSLAIANCFDKRHDAVLRDIRNLLDACPQDFGIHNFVESSYQNEQRKNQPMYQVFFDGFILLVMGYTGKKALAMKLAYIEASNAMRAKIEQFGNSEQLTHADSPLTPFMQSVIRALVKARVEQMPEKGKKLCAYYPQIYSRFNRHFNIAKYEQLSQGKMSEAIEYLVKMEIRPSKMQEVNGAEQAALPEIDPATFKEGAEIFKQLSDLVWRLNTIQNFVMLSYPARSAYLSQQEEVLFENVNDNIKAAQAGIHSAMLNVRSACRVKSQIRFVKP